jgi:hypothetical protein
VTGWARSASGTDDGLYESDSPAVKKIRRVGKTGHDKPATSAASCALAWGPELAAPYCKRPAGRFGEDREGEVTTSARRGVFAGIHGDVLNFGDVTPAHDFARSLTVLETLIRVLRPAVVVSLERPEGHLND